MKVCVIVIFATILGSPVSGQSGLTYVAKTISDTANSIASNSWVPGIKNVLGGIQAQSITFEFGGLFLTVTW